MAKVVLRCRPFEQIVGKHKLKSRGFELKEGSIAQVYALADSAVDDFLYLMGGLHTFRDITDIAPEGHLVRENRIVTKETLTFVELLDRPLYDYDRAERARLVGFIFEDPALFIIGGRVIDDFRYSFSAAGKPVPPIQALERYGLYNKWDRSVDVLSGGERHRLNCASAIELAPRLLLADFSNSNLDDDFMAHLLTWIRQLAESGTAVMLTGLRSEDLQSCTSLVLSHGELLQADPDRALFPTLEEERKHLLNKLLLRAEGNNVVLNVERLCRPHVTEPISFILREGAILIVRGANGCGKTTLGKILVGRIKKRDYSGTFESPAARPILSLQYPERSFITNSVKEELADDKNLIRLCGLREEELVLHPRKLARAQQKLVSAALALSLSEGYAILDEPTCGMDFHAKQRFIDLLNHFNDRGVVIFTHDPALHGLAPTVEWAELQK